jgi:hypothetical protein
MSDKLRTFSDAARAVSGKVQSDTAQGPATSYLAPSRRDKKPKTFFVDPAGARQLKAMAFEMDRPEQEMLVEALNDFFAKHGKAELA